MTTIKYVIGDATYPQGDGLKVIVHVCNDVGRWGKGFVISLSKRWTLPEQSYREWYRDREEAPMMLGIVDWTTPEPGIMVASIIGQHGIGNRNGPPVNYEAIEQGLEVVADAIRRKRKGSVHMPRIGCGLAGGSWDKVEPIIQRQLIDRGIQVTIYDLK